MMTRLACGRFGRYNSDEKSYNCVQWVREGDPECIACKESESLD